MLELPDDRLDVPVDEVAHGADDEPLVLRQKLHSAHAPSPRSASAPTEPQAWQPLRESDGSASFRCPKAGGSTPAATFLGQRRTDMGLVIDTLSYGW
ncbi:hypothetical protein GCM10023196_002240 [Actinoallomurus vinaceus]|uniref:Uncharacterized protein n=1 Tax=Actinoallomurus vinaceus TaxID=1080074 RepID=A0ABP8U3Z5_9ACTN